MVFRTKQWLNRQMAGVHSHPSILFCLVMALESRASWMLSKHSITVLLLNPMYLPQKPWCHQWTLSWLASSAQKIISYGLIYVNYSFKFTTWSCFLPKTKAGDSKLPEVVKRRVGHRQARALWKTWYFRWQIKSQFRQVSIIQQDWAQLLGSPYTTRIVIQINKT